MALIKCANCSKEISDKSEKCIHCGSYCILSKVANKLKISANDLIGIIISIVFSILFYIILWLLAFLYWFRLSPAICISFIVSMIIMAIILLTKKISIKHCVPNLLTSIWFYCIFGYIYGRVFSLQMLFIVHPIKTFCKMYMLPYLIIALLFYFIFIRKKS